MLLEFRTRNYKSFKDELVFSLVPTPKQTGLGYSILREKIKSKIYKGLCSAVIYGPNAAGKTNIIGAMDTFKSIVLNGHIRNDNEKRSPNIASSRLEFIPNRFGHDLDPVEFSIKFTAEHLLIEYAFAAALGNFMDSQYPRKVVSERLCVNNSMIFNRGEKLEFGEFDSIQKLFIKAFDQNVSKAISSENLNEEELFLLNGFKAMFSSKLVSIITNWLRDNFLVIYQSNFMKVTRILSPSVPNQEAAYIEETLNKAAICFGINSSALGYIIDEDNQDAKLCSLFETEKGGIAIPAEIFESYGTIRFINIFPLVIRVLLTGGTLIVDEFDASIHPMALINIINIFHDDQLNPRRAQLVFNTHNPIFLNPNLFRRDEIKFVERDDETHCSTHYSLSDFGTSGKQGVRKGGDYMNGYFINRYGAIKNIDFSSVIRDLLYGKSED